MPLGGALAGWSSEESSVRERYKMTIHNREWEYFSKNSLFPQDDSYGGIDYKAGDIAYAVDYYRTKVGDYTVLIFGQFPSQVAHFPEWLSSRRLLLRQWVETFKIEAMLNLT